MASITQAELQSEVEDHTPGLAAAQVARFANRIAREIAREIGEVERTTLTTTAPVTAGTVSVTSGSSAVTGSGTSFDVPDASEQMIQIEGADSWFRMTQSSATAGTLSSNWPTTTNASATYEIAYPIIELPADCLRVLELRIDGHHHLEPMYSEGEPTDFLTMSPGRPTHWRPYKASSGGDLRIQLGRAPDESYVLTVKYIERPALFDGSTDGQQINLTEEYDDLLIDGTVWLAKKSVFGPEEAREFERDYRRKLLEIRTQKLSGRGYQMGRRARHLRTIRSGAVTEN